MNAMVSHSACTEIVRRLYRAYTACGRRLYGALFFSYCDITALSRDHCVFKEILLRSSEIAEYSTIESLLKTTPE
jgi:hypothetical protein